MINPKKLSGLRRNVLSGMLFAIGSILILLISYPIYLRYLGIELYGLWAILAAVINFTAIGNLGIDIAITKYVSEEYGRKNKSGIERYFSTAIISLLISSILMCIVLIPSRAFIIGVLNIPDKYISIANVLFIYIVVLSVSIFFVKVIDGALRGVGRVDLANYYNLGAKAVSVTTALILLNFGYGIWSLFWGQVLLYILVGSLAFFTIYKKLGTSFFSISSFDLKCLKKIVGFGGTMTASSLISMFMIPFNKVVISRYIGLVEVSYFEIATKAVSQIKSVFTLGIKAIMPEISRLSVAFKESKIKIDNVLKKAMRLVSYLGIPVFILFFFLASFLLRLWLSSQYTPEIGNAFRIILVGSAVNLLSVPSFYLFMGIGKVKYCFIAYMVQSVLNAVVISVFIILGSINFYLIVSIYSLSIAVSAILLIVLFLIYRRVNFIKDYKIGAAW